MARASGVPFHEDDDCLIGPTTHSRWAYAASKTVDEFLGLAYHRQFGLPVVVMRFFNTIGPRQTGRYGMVVPRLGAPGAERRAARGVRRRRANALLWRCRRYGRRASPALAEHPQAVGAGLQRWQHARRSPSTPWPSGSSP